MFCPNCGEKAPVDQRFCRACGFSLEKVAPLLSDGSFEEKANVHIERHGNRLRRTSIFVIGAGMAMALAIGFPAAIYTLFMDGNTIPAVMLSILFISLSSASLIYIIRLMLKQMVSEIKPPKSKSVLLEVPDTDRMLGAVPVLSVAEQTTDKLRSPAVKE